MKCATTRCDTELTDSHVRIYNSRPYRCYCTACATKIMSFKPNQQMRSEAFQTSPEAQAELDKDKPPERIDAFGWPEGHPNFRQRIV